ncbi:PPE family protein [Mycobacterium vicinigordonae]|uniref:PPE family protein n=1 Tax=Mycobacterium vicinigordonae TaxID=1719132 RepID=A0A7D6HMB8_9MYCO|nr:PPE family protein [Mycobacterium vicinigordonae]QLL05791.1 PPE family protein [Mycobacterium vicinigordonae]
MILDFAWLPPEINSARIFAGAGSGPLHVAAAAWESLAADLSASASSFDSVIVGLAGGPWSGPASASMVAAATPYVGWLSAAAAQAGAAAGQARAAASSFEAALTATVHPLAVEANRVSLATLVATNFLGLNTPAIFATEFDYVEMWAQDVAAMLGYHSGATAVAESLMPFSMPPVDLAGLVATVNGNVAGLATSATAALSPIAEQVTAGAATLIAGVQSVASGAPVSMLMQVAQAGAMPASMMLGPLMQLGQTANVGAAGLTGAAEGLADVPKFVGETTPALGGMGGGAGLGAGMAGGLGNARLVGALSVPPTWEGSVPKGMASSAMAGLGGMPSAAAMAQPAGGSGMGMMPMPMGAGGGAGAGMPGGMMGRGGASPQPVQNRPSVIPRTGVG